MSWPPKNRCENCAYGFVDKIRSTLVRCDNKDHIQRDRKSNADFVFERLEYRCSYYRKQHT